MVSGVSVVLSFKYQFMSPTHGGVAELKRIYSIEAQEWGKNFALIIKSSLFEGIFIDAKGVNCTSLEIVPAKKYLI